MIALVYASPHGFLSKYDYHTYVNMCCSCEFSCIAKKWPNLDKMLIGVIYDSPWSKPVLPFIFWGDPDSTLRPGSRNQPWRRDISIPVRAVIQCCGWKAVISSVYVWMSDRQSLGRWSEYWGEIAGQSSPGGALGLVFLFVPGEWRLGGGRCSVECRLTKGGGIIQEL